VAVDLPRCGEKLGDTFNDYYGENKYFRHNFILLVKFQHMNVRVDKCLFYLSGPGSNLCIIERLSLIRTTNA
jgi:hypothetical protein